MELGLSGKVVLVTGAGRGIGRAITEAFLAEGCRVVATDISVEPLEWFGAAAEAAGVDAIALACDVGSTPSVNAVVAAVGERYGRVDVLVNNAGVSGEGLIEDLDDAAWDRCFNVNVAGVMRTCRAVVPMMKRQGSGRIVNAASFAAIVPSVGAGMYAAAKAAVVQLTRTLAGEVGPYGITANSYAPGMIPSGINSFAQMDVPAQQRLLDTLTVRRWGEAAEVAELVVFLASDAARYITGTLVDVSGGKLATQLPQRAYEIQAAQR